MTQELKSNIEVALLLAFEAGKLAGHAELESYFDREQIGECFAESIIAKKTAMPVTSASVGREVTIRIRSEKWRLGVLKESNDLLNNAADFLIKILNDSPSVAGGD